MKKYQVINRIAAACAGIIVSTAAQADAQQGNGAFAEGVKAAQSDNQFVNGVQAQANDAELDAALRAEGVNSIKYGGLDGKTIQRCLITVHTPLPTSMQPAYAKKSARKTAEIASKAKFANFLKSSCVDRQTENGHEIIQNKGTDAGGGSAVQESVDTKTTTTFSETSAQAVCRGIISITEQVDPASGELISVFGWSLKSAGGAVSAEAASAQSSPNGEGARASATSAGQADAAAPQGNPIKGLKFEKAKSSGLSDF